MHSVFFFSLSSSLVSVPRLPEAKLGQSDRLHRTPHGIPSWPWVIQLTHPRSGELHNPDVLTLGRGLRERGHAVTLLSGSKYAASAAGAGLDFLPLPA